MTVKFSAEIQHIAAALLAFQAEATGVVKDSKNPHFKNRYASLEAVVDEARPVLQRVGISWMQAPGTINGGNIGMTTLLMHAASGQWISSDMEIPLGKQDPQGAGSALTYAQRYALMATLGLPPVDDDAESAMPRNPAPSQARVTPANPSLTRTDTGTAGVPLSVTERMIAALDGFDDAHAVFAWWNNAKVQEAYSGLSEAAQKSVDAARRRRIDIIEGPKQEAAE
jgi:hypothetical protein